MINIEQLVERASRRYCQLTGRDPEMTVLVPSMIGGVDTQVPYWRAVVAPTMMEWVTMNRAVQEVLNEVMAEVQAGLHPENPVEGGDLKLDAAPAEPEAASHPGETGAGSDGGADNLPERSAADVENQG